ncbi:MAG TPA: type II secretion system F family protein, partial [Methanomicrobiales archaeon]|nr:type II secretion system F family protein [Methanomicrobiales archaeon]
MTVKANMSTWIRAHRDDYSWLHNDLVSARSGVTIEHYLFQVFIITLLSGLFCALAGFITADIIATLELSSQIYDVFGINRFFPKAVPMLLFKTAVTLAAFALGSILAYKVMTGFPKLLKAHRGTRINLSLHSSVAYMYAMQRGGAELTTIFSSLADNASVFGETAVEFRQLIRDIEYFGYDIMSGLKNLGETTPSEKFRDFIQDLLSVIDSGAALGEFFSGRVRTYQEEARFELKQFITTLEFVAETYVTLFVAGPLFLIIIMVVMGLIGGMGLTALSIVCYALIPIGSVLFIVFLSMISEKVEGIEQYVKTRELREYFDVKVEKKSGEDAQFAQLAFYDRIRRFRDFLRNPFNAFVLIPIRTLYVTIPIAVIYMTLALFSVPASLDFQTKVMVLDDH